MPDHNTAQNLTENSPFGKIARQLLALGSRLTNAANASVTLWNDATSEFVGNIFLLADPALQNQVDPNKLYHNIDQKDIFTGVINLAKQSSQDQHNIHDVIIYLGLPLIAGHQKFGVYTLYFKKNIKNIKAITKTIHEIPNIFCELLDCKLSKCGSSKTDFFSTIGHEIRTPLNSILGTLSLVRDSQLTTEQRDYIEIAYRSTDDLAALLNDVIDLSKIESGSLQLEHIDFDLRQLTEDIAEQMAYRTHGKGLELSLLIHSDAPEIVRGDPARIRQILINLISNAIKFTVNGEITVTISMPDVTKSSIYFAVNDTGIGISKEAQARIFDFYEQADDTTTKHFGGAGLGLAICKELVRLMGGELSVDSVPGKGSTFSFSAHFELIEQHQPLFVVNQNLRDVRLLIISRHHTSKQFLQQQASAWEMTYEHADDAIEAMEKIEAAFAAKTPFDIVIQDFIMPGMDILDFAKELKNTKAGSATKLVLFAPLSQWQQTNEMQQAGVHGYLIKPVRRKHLHDCLAAVIGMSDSNRNILISQHSLERSYRQCKARVLLVEDDLFSQKIVQGMLKKLDLRADIAQNGVEAIDALTTITYDLVFMDCKMPVMDGLTATANIRQHEAKNVGKTPRTPIIAMTANTAPEDITECFEHGMDDHLAKPLRIHMLRQMLEKWLSADKFTFVDIPHSQLDSTTLPTTSEGLEENKVLDPIEIGRLREEYGEDLSYAVELFLEEAGEYIEELYHSYAKKDAETVARTAHTLKGNSRYFGLSILSGLCFDLEQQAKANEFSNADEQIKRIDDEFARVHEELWVLVEHPSADTI